MSAPRGLAAVLALALLLGGCTAESTPVVTQGPEGRCSGVSMSDVVGDRPRYVDGALARFDNDSAVCRAVWLPRLDEWFVPQGLALDGRTAWVSGYRWRKGYGNRPCWIMHVDLRNGRLLGEQRRLEGEVPGRGPVFCRHGGGLALDSDGLWVAETRRLWLLDPRRIGEADSVRRVWRMEEPVSGGALVTGASGALGFADFHLGRDSTTHWFSTGDLLAPGVTTLTRRASRASRAPREVAAARTSVAPRYVQGGAVDAGRRPYLTSSLSTCGVLITPSGERLAFGPGAEGIAFDGRGGLWAVLESGSRNYQRDGRSLVPSLVRFDVDQLSRGVAETCSW